MGINTPDGVRNAFENVLFAIENYCDFLEKNICGNEETSDADFVTEQQLQHRRRNGIREDGRHDSYSKNEGEPQRTIGGISEGEGISSSQAERSEEGEGGDADDKQSTTATGEGDNHIE